MSKLITLAEFYRGRDSDPRYRGELTSELRDNAQRTVDRWSLLLAIAAEDGVRLVKSPDTDSLVVSGWRPKTVNAATPGAAARSPHITCDALDCHDPRKELARWVMDNLSLMPSMGLWFEDMRCTETWVHGQTYAPASGRRVFIPSLAWAQKLGEA